MPLPVSAVLLSFRAYYHDATQDEHNNIYAPLMQEFAVPNGQNPAVLLRDLSSTNNPEMTPVPVTSSCAGSPQEPSGTWILLVRHPQHC